jgi:hypothetical protein
MARDDAERGRYWGDISVRRVEAVAGDIAYPGESVSGTWWKLVENVSGTSEAI